jgi:hypothetical protein
MDGQNKKSNEGHKDDIRISWNANDVKSAKHNGESKTGNFTLKNTNVNSQL